MSARTTPVDRTKPSTACEPCRRRRAKCDRRRPQCSQCIRSSTVCVGYRDNLDLVMRDQNEKVLKAIQKKLDATSDKAAKSQSAASQANDKPRKSSTTAGAAGVVKTSRSVSPAVSQSIYETAVNLFVSNFAHGMHLDWLPHLIGSKDRSTMFEASLEAVSALYLALRDPRVDPSKTAVPRYSVALQEISKALSDVSRATQDDTIASVMLLALYAAWSSPAIETAESWIYHINGAMALLEMRPEHRFDDQIVQSLLLHVIGSVQLDCLSRKTVLPPQLHKICRLSKFSTDAFRSRFWELIAGLVSVRESIANDHGVSDDVFDHVRRLDAEAMILVNSVPSQWTDAVCKPVPTETQPNHPSHRSVQTRNTLHVIRLELNQIILTYSQESVRSDYGNISRINHASEAIEKCVEQICESVPNFLRTTTDEIPLRHDSNMWMCSLIWPFAQAASLRHLLSPSLTQQLQTQFRVFANSSDMPLIRDAAAQIIGGQGVPDGLHVFSLC